MFETEEAKQFFAAWQALRTGDELPHFREVFQRLPTELLPHILIVERMAPEEHVVRFMGTRLAELRQRDFTGQDLFVLMSPRVAAAGRRNFAQVLGKPCGLANIGVFSQKGGDVLALENIVLPAGNDPGRPARALCFSHNLRPPFPVDDDRPDAVRRRWIDLGFGVPAGKPAARVRLPPKVFPRCVQPDLGRFPGPAH